MLYSFVKTHHYYCYILPNTSIFGPNRNKIIERNNFPIYDSSFYPVEIGTDIPDMHGQPSTKYRIFSFIDFRLSHTEQKNCQQVSRLTVSDFHRTQLGI